MADFKTHLSVASIGSGIATTFLIVLDIANPSEKVIFFTLGIIGGFLPDIDSDHSTPIEIVFNFMGLTFAFITIFKFGDKYSVIELLVLFSIVFTLIRYVIYKIFTEFTVHRGIFHSIQAGVIFCFFTAIVLYRIFGQSETASWIGGFFVLFGYLIHLLLDEACSVNMFGDDFKRSFGTALKFINIGKPIPSLLMYLALILLFMATPDFSDPSKVIFNTSNFHELTGKLYPEDEWFKSLIRF